MPKITKFGGHSVAGITDTATGQTEKAHGLVDDTAATKAKAVVRASDDPTGEGYTDSGEAIGLVAGGEGGGNDELPFDPGTLSVADVNALLEDCSPEERAAVLKAERADKNRKGITG